MQRKNSICNKDKKPNKNPVRGTSQKQSFVELFSQTLLFDETSSRAVDANDYTVCPVTHPHTHTLTHRRARARKKAV